MSRNIISYSDDWLLVALTNPTELAVYKNKIDPKINIMNKVVRFHKKDKSTFTMYPKGLLAYPIQDKKGNWYASSESAYFYLSTKIPEDRHYKLMVNILKMKLSQYKTLTDEIELRGGLSYLESCDHRLSGKGYWEGYGLESPFISALCDAYKELYEI